MIVLREMRRRSRALVWPLAGMLLTGYFAYNLVEGNRGLRAWVRLTRELRGAQSELAKVAGERAALEHRVSQMRPAHVDPDLLDEEVRRTLDLAAPDEIVIKTPADKR